MTRDSAPRWRVLLDPPADGAWNMAVDEALLETYFQPGGHAPAPTLRLYGWKPAALSLGRSQPYADLQDTAYLREHRIQLVRRPTGGGAVLHDHERTYALIGRSDETPFRGGVLETYETIAGALVDALRAIGVADVAGRSRRSADRHSRPAACFARTSDHEIEIEGRKAIGSAQLRRSGAFLQHGSILLAAEPQRTARILGASTTPGEAEATGLEDALGMQLDARVLDQAILDALAARFGVEPVYGVLSPAEIQRAVRLRAFKYLSTAWTVEGRSRVVASAAGA